MFKLPQTYNYLGDTSAALSSRINNRCPECSPATTEGHGECTGPSAPIPGVNDGTGGYGGGGNETPFSPCYETPFTVAYDWWYNSSRYFEGVIMQPSANMVWLAGGDSGNLVGVDLETGTVTRTIDVSTTLTDYYWEIETMQGAGVDGASLYITNFQTSSKPLARVDTLTETVTEFLTDSPPLYKNPGIVDSFNGFFWMAVYPGIGAPTVAVAAIDQDSLVEAFTIPVTTGGGNPPYFTVDTVNNRLWVTDTLNHKLMIYDATDGSYVTQITGLELTSRLLCVHDKRWMMAFTHYWDPAAKNKIRIYDVNTFALLATITTINGQTFSADAVDFGYLASTDEILVACRQPNSSAAQLIQAIDGTTFAYNEQVTVDPAFVTIVGGTGGDLNDSRMYIVPGCNNILLQNIYVPGDVNIDMYLHRFAR